MFEKLDKIKIRYHELETRLWDSSCPPLSRTERAKLMKERALLEKTVNLYEQYKDIKKNIKYYQEVLSSKKEESDFLILAKEELSSLKKQEKKILASLKQAIIPKDKWDEKNVIMEIRQATGGDEAGLFCEDLFLLYSRYAEKRNWKVDILSSSPGNSGGFKEIIFSVSGSFVYESLKYESGVHRVQRVPKTETQGRVHTSTATVVVLPSVDAKALQIHLSDIRVDTFRSSGSGGQHVNTTDSAIRVVHLPTKITVQCQDEKSQHANKEKALKVLYARLHDLEMRQKQEKESQNRRSQIGTGDRSEKVRTYNFPQSRVTDHRTGLTLYHLEQVMMGEIEPLLKSLKSKQEKGLLEETSK